MIVQPATQNNDVQEVPVEAEAVEPQPTETDILTPPAPIQPVPAAPTPVAPAKQDTPRIVPPVVTPQQPALAPQTGNYERANVSVAEAVQVPLDEANSTAKKTFRITDALDEQLWLKLGEFDDATSAQEHFRLVAERERLALEMTIIPSTNTDGAVSLRIGPLSDRAQLTEYCLLFRANQLGCSLLNE